MPTPRPGFDHNGKPEIVWHPPVEPILDERGEETHPAFGIIRAARGTSTPGSVLFDSDLRHQSLITLTIGRATRRRDLNHDYIHGGSRRELIEVQMSEAQWAGFVSAMNTQGVPCTIRRTEDNINVDGLPFAPRLAVSMKETHAAAEQAFAAIRAAMDKVDAAETTKDRKDALRVLRSTVDNATPNVDYAGGQLAKHAENVVAKARADIESLVVSKAAQMGLESSSVTFELEA